MLNTDKRYYRLESIRTTKTTLKRKHRLEENFDTNNPKSVFNRLLEVNWIPSPLFGPGDIFYFDNLFSHNQMNINFKSQEILIKEHYLWYFSSKNIEEMLVTWTNCINNNREMELRKGVFHHQNEDYMSSMHLICPSIEALFIQAFSLEESNVKYPIILEKLQNLKPKNYIFEFYVDFIKRMFKKMYINGSFRHGQKLDFSRHGISHGNFNNVYSKENSLRYLLFYDLVFYVLILRKNRLV